MKPEQCANSFFEERPEPVAAADVQQLVTDDSALDVQRKRAQPRRQQDHRLPEPERDGLRQPFVPSHLRMRRKRAL